jgi:hypothetical protein
VDGGIFPLFAPFTPVRYGLPYPVVVAFVAAAVLLAYLAVRDERDLRNPRVLLPLALTAAALSILLYFVAPGFSSFTSG